MYKEILKKQKQTNKCSQTLFRYASSPTLLQVQFHNEKGKDKNLL